MNDKDSTHDNLSLSDNLKRCLCSLRKLREVYSAPMKIERYLEMIDEGLEICLKNCECQQDISTIYIFVLNKLQEIGRFDTGLRLYFSSSPYWEHYHRNVREIYSLLLKCRNELAVSKNKNEVLFERKFVSMDQIVGCRSWGGADSRKTSKDNNNFSIGSCRLASV